LPSTNYTTGEWLLSGSLFGVNMNLTTFALFIDKTNPYVYSNLSLAFRLPAGFTIMPHAQYGYTDKKLISTKLRLEKRVLQHGFLSLSYEQNFRSNLRMGEFGFRYDFRFAQTGFSTRQTDKFTTFVQYARGSLINDRKTGYLGTDKRTNVGRGGITILPYLDKNGNGKRDPGEPKVYGLNLRASGGRIERSEKDTTIRILSLEPYTDCFIELDQSSFDNIAWRLKNRTMSVAVDPNMLKLIEIPINIVGEASGMVMIERDGEILGLARMIVNFYTKDHKLAARTLTEGDGYFSNFGLNPGSFNVRIDTIQLRRLGMISSPDSINFNISANIEGDFVDGLDFTVKMKTQEPVVAPPEITVSRKDTTYMIVHEVIEEVITSTTDSYAIQMGAFKVKSNADAFRIRLAALFGKEVVIFVENGFYKVRILGFETRAEIDSFIPLLLRNGINEMWVISLKGMQKYYIITTKQDTITESIETFTEIQPPAFRADLNLQVGAFRDSARAEALSRKLSALIDKPIVIIPEDGYYKVRITGFTKLEDREKLVPILNILGFTDFWLMPYIPPATEPVVEPEKEPVEEVVIETKPDTIAKESEEEIEISVPAEPTFSLQVGVFSKRSEARKAQRRISKSLKVPVIITEEFGYYKVIVTGFYSREETYKYYPELAGLGYNGIYLIETEK